ncbi:hypothetical protein [Methanosarcina vacuolata]|uniref:Uncharacterized protein n=1 Tax=Methanosarcina vacuolata Z-761 TaxID=1434123 RepID=A0A0E3LHY4_9EURY|nr:hypothetical protein [Methanosarcina vacuolata]AKB45076.1 hypothetical protein MSVAZ_2807 [Methanosarcina vacuolata Z-761]
MIAGTINNTLKAKDPTKTIAEDSVKTAEDSVKTAEDSVKTKGPMWKKEDLGTQIRSFEYQIYGIMEKVVSYES